MKRILLAASPHPEQIVEITISLNNNVPELSEGLIASVSADTLLSDKFILLSGGNPKAPALANGALITSIAPVTFDAILRDLSGALDTLRSLLGTTDTRALNGLLPEVHQLLADLTQTVGQAKDLLTAGSGLISNANSLVDNGDALITRTGKLIDTNAEPLTRTIRQFSTAADSLDALARRADQLVKANEGNINAASADARAALAELREVALSTHAFVNSLRARPQQLLWGPPRRERATNRTEN